MIDAILFLAAFGLSLVGTSRYRRLALKRGIVAKQSFRTLHTNATARGAGVVFVSVFCAATVLLWVIGRVPTSSMLSIGVGGAAAALIGFLDDVHNVRALLKLLSQTGLSVWLFICSYQTLYAPVVSGSSAIATIALVGILLFVPVWMINMYNFIDGIDGLAISAAVFICGAAITVLVLTGGDRTLVLLFALLAASGVGFMLLNMPPASVFMGDAGSMFLGYAFSGLMIATIVSGQISVWTWAVILCYFVGDTTTTTLSRMVLVRRWYGEHRSHAYQNLARIYQSHAKVTYGIALYNICWALPLAAWSALQPERGSLAAALAVGPVVLWTIRFGPRLSSA